MRHHGVPESVIEANEGFWDFIRDTSEAYETDVVLSDGDVITAGGRDLRILARPGHSTTDGLLVDEASGTAFVGDHLLAGISSNAEIVPAQSPPDRDRRRESSTWATSGGPRRCRSTGC